MFSAVLIEEADFYSLLYRLPGSPPPWNTGVPLCAGCGPHPFIILFTYKAKHSYIKSATSLLPKSRFVLCVCVNKAASLDAKAQSAIMCAACCTESYSTKH